MRVQRLIFGVSFAAALYGQGSYVIESIAPPAGFATATATSINQNGLVTGYYTTAPDANGNSTSRPFLYDANSCSLLSLQTINGSSTTAAAVDNAGLVIGTTLMGTGQTAVPRAFASWRGFATDLGGSLHLRAFAMNNSGTVVGSQTPGGQLTEGAVFWTTCLDCVSTKTFPFTLEPIVPSGPFNFPVVTVNPPSGTSPVNEATAINDSGLVAGWLRANGQTWGLALLPGASSWTRISPVPASVTVPGLELSTVPKAINRNGNIAGVAGGGLGSGTHAFFSRNYLLPAIDLGTLNPTDPNTISLAEGINANDWVVGTSTVNTTDFPHAFLHNGTTMIDLNTRVGGGQGWLLTVANSINDSGWIVGMGIHNNRQEGFVLVPEILNHALNPCTVVVSVPFNGAPL